MPSAPPPADSSATAARGSSSRPVTRTRWPGRSGASTTTRPCAADSRMQGHKPSRRTPMTRGPPDSRRRSRPGMAASVNPTPRQGIRLLRLPMRRLLIATFVLLMLLPAVTALAGDNAHDLLIDACRDENVDGTYSQATYKRALGQLPADSDQY